AAAFALEPGRMQVVQAEAELFVLGADAPVRQRLFARREDLDQLVAMGDRCIAGVAGARHADCSGGGREPGRTGVRERHYGAARVDMAFRHWNAGAPPVRAMGAAAPACRGDLPSRLTAATRMRMQALRIPSSPDGVFHNAGNATMEQRMTSRHPERHRSHRAGWLRAAVLGANDGIVSVSGVVVGIAAAGAPHQTVLVTGVAATVAGAISMAAGEYVSVQSQADTEAADLAVELRELREEPAAELEELAAIYRRRGLEPTLARTVAEQLTH